MKRKVPFLQRILTSEIDFESENIGIEEVGEFQWTAADSRAKKGRDRGWDLEECHHCMH